MNNKPSSSPSPSAPQTAKFLQGSLMKHVVTMSTTTSIGLMAIFAVDFIDMIFIAMLGNQALAAAVGYAGTIIFFTTSIGIGLSIAAGALVSRALGAGKPEQAREYASSVMVFGLLVAVLTVIAVFSYLSVLLDFLGVQGETRSLARSYLTIIIPSMPILTGSMIASAVLRAHGDAKRAMWATLFGGIVNAVLDPILIFSLGMGLEGAAWASFVARITMLAVAIRPAIYLYHGFAAPKLSFFIRDAAKVAGIAGPAIMTNVATPIGTAIVMREMARFGTDLIAGMAIIARLTPVAFALVFALSGAIGPIIGQNFGSGSMQRVRGAFNASLLFTLAYVGVVATLLFLLRQPIAGLFNAEGQTKELLYLFCGPLALAFYFNGIIFISNAMFNNLGHPIYSTYINWGRHTLGTWPFILAGITLWGANGVLIGQAIGGFVFALIALVLVLRVMNRPISNDDSKTTSVENPFKRQERLQAVHCRRH